MEGTAFKGTISFINHLKKNAMIDYVHGGKKKTVSFKTGDDQGGGESSKTRKGHHYRMGDEVNFKIKPSSRGDKMIAYDIQFLYNTALEKLIQRSSVENHFKGYLKVVDEDYYIKELESYLFFPLKMSKWEKKPDPLDFPEAISFKLLNIDKPNNIAAELFMHHYIPEFKKAQHHLKSKTPVEALVTRVSPYAVYLDLFDGKMPAKLDRVEGARAELKEGDSLKVTIIYVSESRIVVE